MYQAMHPPNAPRHAPHKVRLTSWLGGRDPNPNPNANPNPNPNPNQVRLTSWLDGREDISAAMILMPYIAAFVLVLVCG